MMFTPSPHTVADMFSKLKSIAMMSGSTSMQKKIDSIKGIFVACRHSEARFFVRSLMGKLRIGLAEQSVIQALAQAVTFTPPSRNKSKPYYLNQMANKSDLLIKSTIDANALVLKTVYCRCPDFHQIIPVLIENDIEVLLEKCKMKPGIPLKPMLAHVIYCVSN
jgi:DNA ligase 1